MSIKIDKNYRIKIPLEIIEKLKIKRDDMLDIQLVNREIILTKSIPACIFCDSAVDLVRKGDTYICIDCIQELSKAKTNDQFY